MTAATAPRPAAPATGLFGGGKTAPEVAEQDLVVGRGEPTATQRKSFSDLFRADGAEFHAA